MGDNLKQHVVYMTRYMSQFLSYEKRCSKLMREISNPQKLKEFEMLLASQENELRELYEMSAELIPKAQILMELAKKAEIIVQESKRTPNRISALNPIVKEMEKLISHEGLFG